MSRKPRLTTFSRFVLFLLLIVPTAFVVSHMANNNWSFNKDIFLEDLGLKQKTEIPTKDTSADVETNEPTTDNAENTDSNDGNSNPMMEKRVEELERQLEEMQTEMKALKNKFESLNTADNSTIPTSEGGE